MKERFEWVQSWCDETLSDDLPRVLLIGDSITRQYQDRVRELLRDKCYVDYFSSSYAADSPLYKTLIKAFIRDSKYSVIPDKAWGKRVSERNAAIDELSEEFGFSIDDLYSVSRTIDSNGRSNDGTHFKEEGIDILANIVVKSILNVLNNR